MIELNIGQAASIADQIAKLENDFFGNDLERIYIVDKQIMVLYAIEQNQLIAFLTFKRDLRSIEIYNFGVAPEYRRIKLGTRMINTFNTFDCSLEVRESNHQAISFYESNGFYKSFTRKNYYGSEHAIVLERKKTMTENAYAKINLVLNVIDKLDNGYHQIEFLMNTVDLHDVVTVTGSESDQVIVVGQPQLSNLDNLAYRALDVLRNEFGFKTKYKIEIEKNIPVAAGMAGGSSDAAAVLRIVNQLENLEQSDQQLAALGAKVGSDVSFCVHSKLAIARGTGEQIELVENTIPTKFVLVVNPGVPLSTVEVYNHHQLNDVIGNIDKVLNADSHLQFETNLSNSLAVTAEKLCPQMKELKFELEQLTNHRILVSGSGPTLLVFSENHQEIAELYERLSPKYQNIHIAKMN